MRSRGFVLAAVLSTTVAGAQPSSPEWVEVSNEHAQVLLRAMAELSPESAARYGVEGIDEQILDLSAGHQRASTQGPARGRG